MERKCENSIIEPNQTGIEAQLFYSHENPSGVFTSAFTFPSLLYVGEDINTRTEDLCKQIEPKVT